MTAYCFRLRFNFPDAYRIGADVEQLELLVLPNGERIKLRSDSNGTLIKDHSSASILGGPYESEDQARTAAEKSKYAVLYWAIEQRLGIDFGDGKQRSIVTNEGLAMLEKQYGCPFRTDIHGIDVYEQIDKLQFAKFSANARVDKNPQNLIKTFCHEYVNSRELTEKQILASEIYAGSFFDVAPRSRFITLVTAVEALLEPLKRSEAVQTLVEDFRSATHSSNIDEATKRSIMGSLQWLRYESIGQAGRALARRLIPNDIFNGQSSDNFFTQCYNLRSQIMHRGAIEDESVDIFDLANTMELFVSRLLLASLNNRE